MKVRGERECRECGRAWSYFETGSVECPSCGSLRSVGTGTRKRHTDDGGELDLASVRRVAGDEPLHRAASAAEDACRSFVRSRGFVSGGELLALDDVFVAAQELKYAAAHVGARMHLDDAEERYLLALVRGAESGDRPPVDDVPTSVRSARGLAAAASAEAYRHDLREFVADADTDAPADARRFLDRLADQERRIRALDGDVDPATADALIDAARAVGRYVDEPTDATATTASRRLSDIE